LTGPPEGHHSSQRRNSKTGQADPQKSSFERTPEELVAPAPVLSLRLHVVKSVSPTACVDVDAVRTGKFHWSLNKKVPCLGERFRFSMVIDAPG
jgi:hypothetical protein